MKTDWGAKWFEIRESLGESDLITMRYRDPGKPPVNDDFPHRHGDGFGRLQQILRGEGLAVHAPSRPLRPPSEWKKPLLLIEGALRYPKADVNPWRDFVRTRALSSPDDAVSVQWTEEQTRWHRERAKTLGLSPAFLLLNDLSRLLREDLVKPHAALTWLFPVDLRGAFPDTPLDKICVSFLPIALTEKSDIRRIAAKFRRELKRGDYWAYWELYQIGKYVGENGVRRIAARASARSFWAGSFSDLGTWNDAEFLKRGLQNREWIISPPGSASYPVSVSTLEWCGRRTTTLKLHPAITPHPPREVAQRLLKGLDSTSNP